MASTRHRLYLQTAIMLCMVLPGMAHAADDDNLVPFQMLRSLQFVQDSVVLGDHSAAEMQRFLLGTIDQRLRTVDASVFEDPRNVDAALIYAMSGGNPATLEWLVAKDVNGNFDNRVADALRKYLSGKGTLVANSIAAMVPEYRDKKVGAYLALISGNVSAKEPVAALKFYDWARLMAPGTIVEEAALRRSISVSIEAGLVDKGLDYSNRYARRFLHSPYASQFADLFVQLAVDHFGVVTEDDINATLVFMDTDRQREVYLRIARKAAIAGKNELARSAAEHAATLSGGAKDPPESLASLYGGLANIPTSDVGAAMQAILDVPEENLSPRDIALRNAARMIAEEVLRKPEAKSPAQDMSGNVADIAKAQIAAGSQSPQAAGNVTRPTLPTNVADAGVASPMDPVFQTFVDGGRSKLAAIDKLLKEESVSK